MVKFFDRCTRATFIGPVLLLVGLKVIIAVLISEGAAITVGREGWPRFRQPHSAGQVHLVHLPEYRVFVFQHSVFTQWQGMRGIRSS